MITLSYTVAGQLIEPASVPQYLVADTVGVYQVAFTFDADWADMSEKTVVFRNPQVIDPDYRDVPVEFPLDANGQALVPAVLLDPGKLFIGVYGTNSTQQLPTIWAPPLQVVPGASPGVEPSDDPALGSVIRTIPQTLTEEEKAQARENIGANEIEGGTPGNVVIIDNNLNIADSGKSLSDLYDAAMISKTASGSIVTIEDGADDVPIKEMTVQIVPVQAGSGDPSQTNNRPISGWTGENLYRGDDKVVIIGGEVLDITVTGVHFHKYENGYMRIYGKSTAVTSRGFISFTANQTSYYFSGFPTLSGYLYWFIYDNDTAQRVGDFRRTLSGEINEFVTGHSYAIAFRVNGANQSADVAFMPVISAVPTEPTVYEIEFPSEAGTVYGGERTVNEDGTGTLTSDWAYQRLQGTVTQYPGTGFELLFYITGWQSGGAVHIYGNGTAFEPSYRMCNMMKSVSNVLNAKTDRGTFSFSEGSTTAINRLYGVYPDGVNSASEMTEWLANNDVYIAYKLQTPTTYDLTAEEVASTLHGLNNIWADTGDISITYRADPTLATAEQAQAIKESIAYYQTDYTAKQAYVVNDLVYVEDVLYIVTSAIAQGATMTPNTNCRETTLNEVIKSLR